MEIVSRDGPLVKLRDKRGKLWLTRRLKRKKDSRGRVITAEGWSVRHIPIERIVERGDWIFTCSLSPLQFDKWNPKNDMSGFNRSAFTDDEWEKFRIDDFQTIEGSHHSRKHCSLTPISDEYAQFFIKHNLTDLFHINGEDFDKYEEAVKKVCESFKIKYEGI